jgi:hypothetical protein
MVAVVVVEGVIIIIILTEKTDKNNKNTKRDWLKGSAFISTVYRLSNLRSPLLCALRKKIVSRMFIGTCIILIVE